MTIERDLFARWILLYLMLITMSIGICHDHQEINDRLDRLLAEREGDGDGDHS